MKTVWSDTVKLTRFPRFEGKAKTDVLIIGGGIAGILCAYFLNKSGKRYILLEANRICGGITHATTAKLTAQHGLVYDKLIREFGILEAKLYLRANEEAIESFRKIEKNASCDLEETDSYIYSIENKDRIMKEYKALIRLGCNADYKESLDVPFEIEAAIGMKNQAQINPLKFILNISENMNIYEMSKVRELKELTAFTDYGRVEAKSVIVATHFPFINRHGCYFMKMHQHRSHIIALENAQRVKGIYADEAQTGPAFRNYGNYLLLTGGGHRTGKTGGGYSELFRLASEYYPKANIKYRWSAQDCMTLDGMPYIGQYSKSTPDLYVATGFNKWGMTSSVIAARLLTDLIMKNDNKFVSLFSPSRRIIRKQLAINTGETVFNLLNLSKNRCPHMGCALKWNSQELSWDCPCHGSRFSHEGKLLDNPANEDWK